MKEKLEKLVKEWLIRSSEWKESASNRFRFSDWQMGNVDSSISTTYEKVALELQKVLDEHQD